MNLTCIPHGYPIRAMRALGSAKIGFPNPQQLRKSPFPHQEESSGPFSFEVTEPKIILRSWLPRKTVNARSEAAEGEPAGARKLRARTELPYPSPA